MMYRDKANMTRVLVCGYYGSYNRGDELILKVITEFLKNKNVYITVTSLDPEATSKEYGVRAIKSYRSRKKGLGLFVKEIVRADLFVLGGGGLFQDYGRHFRIVLFYCIRVLIAGLLRRKIMYFALGVGNVEMKKSKWLINYVSRYTHKICVRDEESKIALENMGVKKKIHVCADPVFTLMQPIQHKVYDNYRKNTKCVGISVLPYEEQLMISSGVDTTIENSIICFCKELIKKGHEIIFIPMEKRTDDMFIRRIIENGGLKKNVEIIDSSLDHQGFLSSFRQCDIVVGMRLHAIILSAIYSIPIIPISYHSKVLNTLKSLGQQDVMIDLKDLDSNTLMEKFEIVMNGYESRRKDISLKAHALSFDAFRALNSLDGFITK